jgi:hypothetical protein
VIESQSLVEEKLDGSFFRVRADRTTELELAYRRAMAELGPDPYRTADVAKVLRALPNSSHQYAGCSREGTALHEGYGLAAFKVPQFDRYMTRNDPLTIVPAKKRQRL